MIQIELEHRNSIANLVPSQKTDLVLATESISERVRLLIIRDLLRLGWRMSVFDNVVSFEPPGFYDKQVVRNSLQLKRKEILLKNSLWINSHLKLARENLADGHAIWESDIRPIIEVCRTEAQHRVFRLFRYYWSSPYSDYVGRRIKLLIRDDALPNKPLIGIAALGSSIVHIPDRDNWVGWDTGTRTRNLIYAMDAYVLGALPPYNYLLGGKLISYIIASNEVREIYANKYKSVITNISKRKANKLACVFTTSLFGKSSQYNRIKFDNKLLYLPIGNTRGYGTLHLSEETFNAMRSFLESLNIHVPNRFGDGPIWRMRVIRTAADALGLNADFLLKHSFQREIYAIPLAYNSKEFLRGEQTRLDPYDLPLNDLVNYWKERWLYNRKKNPQIKENVINFNPDSFEIF